MTEISMRILSLFDGEEPISRVNIATKLRLEIDLVQDQLDWLQMTGYVQPEGEGNFYRLTEDGLKGFNAEVVRRA